MERLELLSLRGGLACLAFLCLAAGGYPQSQPDVSREPGIQNGPAVQQPLGKWPKRQRAGLRVTVDLAVSPPVYTGTCPAAFTLKGHIHANGPTEVQYKFIRNDHVQTQPMTLTFDKPGSQEVTVVWQIGESSVPSTFALEALMEVVYPLNTKVRSNKVVFKGTCTIERKNAPAKSPGAM